MNERIVRVATEAASPPAGHYSQASIWRDLVFVSGQLPVKKDGSHTVDQPFDVQARQAIDNMLAILLSAGCGPEHVLRTTAYIVGTENWPIFNRVYADIFGTSKPSRSVVPVPTLHHGYLVEIEAIAAHPSR